MGDGTDIVVSGNCVSVEDVGKDVGVNGTSVGPSVAVEIGFDSTLDGVWVCIVIGSGSVVMLHVITSAIIANPSANIDVCLIPSLMHLPLEIVYIMEFTGEYLGCCQGL